jgi:nucleoside-diphosphate-sugar epimerase
VAANPGPKKILILGGTGFIGPHVVDAARTRGHMITLFNRGKTHPKLFPDVEKLRGDRDGKLDALNGRAWDAVVDTSGYVPRIVKQSVELLAPKVGHYLFVSTMSVYANEDKVDADETAEVQTLDDPATEDVSKAYGPLKAACEAVCEAGMPGQVTNLRTGWMVGPLDPTGRFTYWPSRLSDGGEVLAPGDGSMPIQLIDARDMAAFIITAIENTTVGTFNVFGPSNHPKVQLTMKQLIEARVRNAEAEVTDPVLDVHQRVVLAKLDQPKRDSLGPLPELAIEKVADPCVERANVVFDLLCESQLTITPHDGGRVLATAGQSSTERAVDRAVPRLEAGVDTFRPQPPPLTRRQALAEADRIRAEPGDLLWPVAMDDFDKLVICPRTMPSDINDVSASRPNEHERYVVGPRDEAI